MIEPVSVHVVIPSPPGEVWRYLTVDELVGTWFADSRGLRSDGSFRFEFGDGDYFTGDVTEWRDARVLALQWRFMGIGPTFQIRYELAECDGGTLLTVTDRGASTASEAASLREGWSDFLMRLAKAMSTRGVTRYEWSETISTAALVGNDGGRIVAMLSEAPWWEARFPGAKLTLTRIAGGVAAEIRDPAWAGVATRAEVTLENHSLQVRHDGWAHLPAAIRLAERKRVAGVWATSLAELEATATN